MHEAQSILSEAQINRRKTQQGETNVDATQCLLASIAAGMTMPTDAFCDSSTAIDAGDFRRPPAPAISHPYHATPKNSVLSGRVYTPDWRRRRNDGTAQGATHGTSRDRDTERLWPDNSSTLFGMKAGGATGAASP